MKHNRLDYWGHRLPGFEDTTHPKKKKLYAESSHQSVRETMEQWQKASAQRRLDLRQQDEDISMVNSIVPLPKRKSTAQEKQKSTRRSSHTTPRDSLQAETAGPVVVTNYSHRNSMEATQIQTDQGTPLRFHEPVRGSVEGENMLRESVRRESALRNSARMANARGETDSR